MKKEEDGSRNLGAKPGNHIRVEGKKLQIEPLSSETKEREH